MQSTLIDIVPKVMLKAIDKYVAFTDFEFTDETLESLKYYHSIFDPTSDEKKIMKQFANCCETGQLKVLKWLTKTYGDIVKYWVPNWLKYGIWLIHLTYYNGHENVVKWLEETFNMDITSYDPVADPSRFDDEIFCRTMDFTSACEHGKLDLVKNIIKLKELNIKDITYDNNWAFRRACIRGYYDIAEWLEETYNVLEKSKDIYALYADVFSVSTKYEIPVWIARKINSARHSYMVRRNI